jgi:N,N'-diacetyllegionaminate synthase
MKNFQPQFSINQHKVGSPNPCLIIAEAGVSHFGDLDKAYALVDIAVEAGADIFKTQHFNTDVLIGPSSPEWRDRMKSKELTNGDIKNIHSYCTKKGITFLCTAHDESVLDFLDNDLDMPAFKIGSGELNNWPFLKNIASRNKPIILSTGMYELNQIKETIELILNAGCDKLAILHCVTNYPAQPVQINLRFMETITKLFNGPVGYSDHTEGNDIPLAAVARGARIIEKHITLEKNIPDAQDWKVACDRTELIEFVKSIRRVEQAIGSCDKEMATSELNSVNWACKSLTARELIPTGTIIQEAMLISQRPGTGIPPSKLNRVVGCVATKNLNPGEIISKTNTSYV